MPTDDDASGSYATALRRRWWLIVLAAAVAATVAYLVSDLVLPTVYRSSATVIVLNQPTPAATDASVPIQPFVDDQSLSETFQHLALQPDVTDQVAASLGITREDAVGHVGAHALPRTPLVVLTFDASTAAESARGARVFVAQFVQSSQSSFLPGRALVVSGATEPTSPIAPRPLLNTLVAGIAGLLLGLAIALSRGRSAVTPAHAVDADLDADLHVDLDADADENLDTAAPRGRARTVWRPQGVASAASDPRHHLESSPEPARTDTEGLHVRTNEERRA